MLLTHSIYYWRIIFAVGIMETVDERWSRLFVACDFNGLLERRIGSEPDSDWNGNCRVFRFHHAARAGDPLAGLWERCSWDVLSHIENKPASFLRYYKCDYVETVIRSKSLRVFFHITSYLYEETVRNERFYELLSFQHQLETVGISVRRRFYSSEFE